MIMDSTYSVKIEIPLQEYGHIENVAELVRRVIDVDKDLNSELVRRSLASENGWLFVTYTSADVKKLRA